jgi:hypothetical protein
MKLHMWCVGTMLGLLSTVSAADDSQTSNPIEPAAVISNEAAQLKDAIEQVAKTNRRVLLISQHGQTEEVVDLEFIATKLLRGIVNDNYQVVSLSRQTQARVLKKLEIETRTSHFGLAVIDENGDVVAEARQDELRQENRYSVSLVSEFLKKSAPEHPDARDIVAAAFEQARREQKSLILTVGSDECSACLGLKQFLQDHEYILSRDYILLDINPWGPQKNAMSVAKELNGGQLIRQNPLLFVVDEMGEVVERTNAPERNIGFPGTPEEMDYFFDTLLKATRKIISDDELAAMRAKLEELFQRSDQGEQSTTHDPSSQDASSAEERP